MERTYTYSVDRELSEKRNRTPWKCRSHTCRGIMLYSPVSWYLVYGIMQQGYTVIHFTSNIQTTVQHTQKVTQKKKSYKRTVKAIVYFTKCFIHTFYSWFPLQIQHFWYNVVVSFIRENNSKATLYSKLFLVESSFEKFHTSKWIIILIVSWPTEANIHRHFRGLHLTITQFRLPRTILNWGCSGSNDFFKDEQRRQSNDFI